MIGGFYDYHQSSTSSHFRSRSRANSASLDRVNRRSQSNTPGLGSAKRRSQTNFTDDEEGAAADTDPFLTYRSFKQFQNEEGNFGSIKREAAKTKVSSESTRNSSSYNERKLSNSMSAAKISLSEKYSNGFDSVGADSSLPYTPGAKLSSGDRSGLGGMFSSTPKYPDSYRDSSIARQSSTSTFSNGDSGYSASASASASSFSSFSNSSVLSKRNSGVFSSDTGPWSGAAGKISLGSLK